MRDSLAYINGRFLPQSQAHLELSDAGFVFGATITDFARTYQGRLHRYEDHAVRLIRHALSIGISLSHSSAQLAGIAQSLQATNGSSADGSSIELAIVTFATPGPIGYYLTGLPNPPTLEPTLGMHTFPLPLERYRPLIAHGAILVPTPPQPLPDPERGGFVDPQIKHRSRLMWWLADQHLRSTTTPEPGTMALLLTDQGHLTETAIAALGVIFAGTLTIPPAKTILESLMLRYTREIAQEQGIPVIERPLEIAECQQFAQEALLMGTAFGIAGVRRLADRDLPCPGPITRRLIEGWHQRVGMDLHGQILGG